MTRHCDKLTSSVAPVDRRKAVAALRERLRESSDTLVRRNPAYDSRLEQLIGGTPGPRRLLDVLGSEQGSAAGLIGLSLCGRACSERGELVVIDPNGVFFPAAAIAWGVDSRRLLVVSPERAVDSLAVVETALRSPAVGAVWSQLGAIEGRAFRRLLLAAESGNAFGVLVRSGVHAGDPSWANIQLAVDPLPGPDASDKPFVSRVRQLRNRHGPVEGEVDVVIDWQSGQIKERDDPREHAALTESPALRLVS
ncbi:MAG: hypothetical protein AAF266_11855 [Planctomycetota bacterium]